MSDRCVHISISGRVQGVGFRQWVKDHALQLHLKGWVRNCQAGFVEAVFKGEKHKVDHMIALCQEGSVQAQVQEILMICEEDKDVDGFGILLSQ